jgi:hypothetical protein
MRSPVESFRTKQPVQLTNYLTMLIPERQPHARGRIEHHNRHTILVRKYVEGLLCSGRNPLNMGLHAPAHIQQEKNVDGHVLARNVANRQDTPVQSQYEIIDL